MPKKSNKKLKKQYLKFSVKQKRYFIAYTRSHFLFTHTLSLSRTLKVNAIGQASLEELRKQSQQMDDIHTEIAVVGTKLDQSQSLQNRFDLWVTTHSLK